MLPFDHYLAPATVAGPQPASVLDAPQVDDLLRRSRLFREDTRKAFAYFRWQILREKHDFLVKKRIQGWWNDQDTKQEIERFITLSINPALEIVRALVVTHRRPPLRTIEGIEEAQSKAFRKLLTQARLDQHAEAWSQAAWYVGPTIVVPVVRGHRMTWDTLLPHFYDIVRDPEDPTGPPVAAAWRLRGQDADLGMFRSAGPKTGKADSVVLDGMSWRYYRTSDAGKAELLEEIPHELGFFPGALLRFDVPLDDDWYSSNQHERLTAGTIDIATLNTKMSYVRKTQDRKVPYIIGAIDQVAKRQKLDPEVAMIFRTEVAAQLTLGALDFETNPDGFIKHIDFLYQGLVRGYAQQAVVNMEGTGPRITIGHESETELRSQQVPHAREFEHDLAVKVVAVARALKHPDAGDLPTVEQVRDGFRVRFPKLARSMANPKDQREQTEWEWTHGMSDPLEALAEQFPGLGEAELWKILEARLKRLARWHQMVTSRDFGMKPSQAMQTVAQMFGRMGPAVRDANNPPPEGEGEPQPE